MLRSHNFSLSVGAVSFPCTLLAAPYANLTAPDDDVTAAVHDGTAAAELSCEVSVPLVVGAVTVVLRGPVSAAGLEP